MLPARRRHRGLGQAYQQLGQNDQAVESYRRALALNDKDVASLNNLAWIVAEVRKKPDEALALLALARSQAPNAKLTEVLATELGQGTDGGAPDAATP